MAILDAHPGGLPNATLGGRDFYRQLCLALGLQPSATAAAVFYAVTVQVENFAKDCLHPVFLLDEAHLPHQDTLDHLHILLNYAQPPRFIPRDPESPTGEIYA